MSKPGYILSALATALFAITCSASERLPEKVSFNQKGEFEIDNCVKARVLHYNSDWTGTTQSQLILVEGQGLKKAESFRIKGKIPLAHSGSVLDMVEQVNAISTNHFSYEASLHVDREIDYKFLCLALNLPATKHGLGIIIDGKRIQLSGKDNRKTLFQASARKVKLELPSCRVEITGDFHAFVQGVFRKGDYYSLRLSPENMPKKLKDWKLKLDFKITDLTPKNLTVDLRQAVNMDLKDEVAGDSKGGWTDQGALNDLRQFKPGKFSFSSLNFDVIDAKKNNNKACIVLSGNQRKYPVSREVRLKHSGEPRRYLYLLHATAWTPSTEEKIGSIKAVYSDGSKREFILKSWVDAGNWWNPGDLPNGVLAWEEQNSKAAIGLYVSKFEIDKVPEKLIFESGNANVWMIVAASFSDVFLPPAKRIKHSIVITAGSKYIPLEFNGKTVSGSVLDFSRYNERPAGKYGHVKVSGEGHFVFEKAMNKRIRFIGTNLVGSANYLSKKEADKFVRKAVSLGYNTVRLHHFEYGILNHKAKDTLTFDPVALDKLDYLFAELKKHGIYMTIDLYASRKLKAGDGIEECKKFNRYEMKGLVPISRSAMKNWKEFARRLLTRKNPYTGMSLAEDPALYSLNLVNENILLQSWMDCPDVIPIYNKLFDAYLKKHNISLRSKQRDGHFINFLNELQSKCIDEQKEFLTKELKLKALVTDLNHKTLYSMIGLRNKLDFVDNHQYWDHPRFAGKRWSYPYLFHGKSSISELALNPREMMPSRIFGKPFTVTEYNFCNPNPYRMECAPLIGGYASLQDWDGLYRFAWSHGNGGMKKILAPNHFDSVNNPMFLLSERITFLLFVRNYVKAAKPAFACLFRPEMLKTFIGLARNTGKFPKEFSILGLYARIGSVTKDNKFPGLDIVDPLHENWTKELPEMAQKVLGEVTKKGVVRSSTGEITLDSKQQSLLISAPKCEVAAFSGNVKTGVMSLSNARTFRTVALLSLDGLDLKDSRKMMFIHMPNIAAQGQAYTKSFNLKLESWGKLPVLLEKTKVNVSLALPETTKVEMLKLDGSVNGNVATQFQNGKLLFTADTAAKKGGVMVYLLTR